MNNDPSHPTAGHDPSSSYEHDHILMYRKCPVRIVTVDGLPWFALPDICEAAGYHAGAARAVDALDFPEHAKLTFHEQTEDGPRDITMLSPVGVWWLTALANPGKGQNVAAWARRQALAVCPDPGKGDPAMFLSLGPNCTLPPRPMRYSGRLLEWEDLRDHRIDLIAKSYWQPMTGAAA